MTERQLQLFGSRRQRGIAVDYSPSEFEFQCSVADLLRQWAKPTWQWTAIPLGEERPAEYRNGKRVSFAGERLKRQGVQRGWPDLVLIAPKGHPRAGVAHFLELKSKSGRLSEEQDAFRLWCLLNGLPHSVARDVDEVIAKLGEWGVWRGVVRRS